MEQNAWARGVVALIAESVKYHRLNARPKKLSAQKVAERCEQLGLPSLTRSVITSIEMGTRESISIPEWLVLAEALEVPPLLLLFPVGREKEVQALPERPMPPWDALVWAESGPKDGPLHNAVLFFRRHHELADQCERTLRQLQYARAEADGTADWEAAVGSAGDGELLTEPPDQELAQLRAEQLEKELRLYKGRLKIIRAQIDDLADLGVQLPSLPAALAGLDNEEPVL